MVALLNISERGSVGVRPTSDGREDLRSVTRTKGGVSQEWAVLTDTDSP